MREEEELCEILQRITKEKEKNKTERKGETEGKKRVELTGGGNREKEDRGD